MHEAEAKASYYTGPG